MKTFFLIIFSASITLLFGRTLQKEYNEHVYNDKVNEIITETTSHINSFKTAIVICLQRNDGNYNKCNSFSKESNIIPNFKNYLVSKSVLEINVNTASLQKIKITPNRDGKNLNWNYECTGDKNIILTNFFSMCNKVIFN